MIITIFSQNYIFFTNLALYMIGKKGASCRKEHSQRKILIHKRKILLSYEQRRGGAYRHVGMGWTKSGEGYLLCQKRQTLEGNEAMLCGDVCKYLQTFEAKDANVWGKGCNALRLRRAKLALKSSVLFWIREKGGADTPLTSHCSPLEISTDPWFHIVHGEIHKK